MPKHDRAILDTSVIIDLELIGKDALPTEIAISAVTLAELAVGPLATDDPAQRALRQDRLQRVEAHIRTLPVDRDTARAYTRMRSMSRRLGFSALRWELG